MPSKEWKVFFHDDFERWLLEQDVQVQDAILAKAKKLQHFGPSLGRPDVDTLHGAKLKNLKELRVQYGGEPWRVLFAFDPERQAILLVGGNKEGDKHWYKKAIPVAEKRYEQHVEELRRNHGKNT